MKPRILVVVFVSFLILASRLSAFGGQRKGFILGGGLGGNYLSWDDHVLNPDLNWTATANFKVGYAPSNSLEVYWANIVSYISSDGDSFASGASCIAVTKYLKPEGRGLFFCGGVGLAHTHGLEGASSDSGFGGFAGLGYEFAKHFYIQADALYSDVQWTPRWEFRVTLNFLAF